MNSVRFGKYDIIYLSVLAVLILILLVILYTGGTDGDVIVITGDGEEYGRYALDEDQEIAVYAADGTITNLVIIEDGAAFMQEADCPDGLCMKQGSISRDKQNIVCLPNRVVVTVASSEEADVDAVAQ